MNDLASEDYHVIVFLDANGMKMMSTSTSVEAADVAEARVRTGTWGSLQGLTFVERQFRNAEWRKAHIAP